MSVKELQARIDKLVAVIDLQKEVLKQLEHSKSAAQRQLNAIRDPVARLPLEISSAIFLQCLPRAYPKLRARSPPILLLNVCQAWTEIALSTRALWAALHIDFPAVEMLQTWLQRTRNHPLSISLRRCLDSRVTTILRQYAKQLEHLKIYDEEIDDLDSLAGLESFPFLRTLTIGALCDSNEDLNTFSLDHIMRLLRLAPNLVECTFHNVCAYGYEDNKEILVLPRLLCLKFGTTTAAGNLAGEDSILRHLTLPAVRTLALPVTDISATDVSLFLKRSSPPLQKLVLGNGCRHFRDLEAWLRLVPSVAHFELGPDQNSTLVEDLLSALTDSPHLLPNLCSLKVLFNFRPWYEPLYQKVFRALLARCTQLVHVEIRAAHVVQSRIDPDIHAGLRKLAAQGIRIYIGNHKDNFI